MKHSLIILLAIAASSAIAGVPRSEQAKHDFALTHPCPATQRHTASCKGYIIDHITPLDCGGADAPSNMQWQTVAAAKAKDKWERNGPNCKHRTHAVVK